MSYNTYLGDCIEVMKTLQENSVDSVITDPPYGLKFMGKDWDHGVPGEQFWREAFRVAKPGAFLLAFGGTRMYHRLAVAIEDAGWEVKDCLMWVYGSGFPKGQDIGKMIDKQAGVKRETGKVDPYRAGRLKNQTGDYITSAGWSLGNRSITNDPPATEEAKQWDGWSTCLKPAWEPIILAQKPISEKTIAKNVLRWGTGALNVDRCRVEYVNDADRESATPQGKCTSRKIGTPFAGGGVESDRNDFERPELKGRYPANLIHDGSDEVIELFPESKGQQGDVTGFEQSHTGEGTCYGDYDRVPFAKRDDSGSAARFFYCAKASKKDRGEGNVHPTVKPRELMQYLCKLVTQPNGIVLDPFMGSGSTGIGAVLEGFNFIGIEKENEYLNIANNRIEGVLHG